MSLRRAVAVAARLQPRPQRGVVVDLAVEDDPDRAVLVRHRLVAARHVDDGQPAVGEPHRRRPGTGPRRRDRGGAARPACDAGGALPRRLAGPASRFPRCRTWLDRSAVADSAGLRGTGSPAARTSRPFSASVDRLAAVLEHDPGHVPSLEDQRPHRRRRGGRRPRSGTAASPRAAASARWPSRRAPAPVGAGHSRCEIQPSIGSLLPRRRPDLEGHAGERPHEEGAAPRRRAGPPLRLERHRHGAELEPELDAMRLRRRSGHRRRPSSGA